jgi:hypothetical protein
MIIDTQYFLLPITYAATNFYLYALSIVEEESILASVGGDDQS